jgi:hypothetical protein
LTSALRSSTRYGYGGAPTAESKPEPTKTLSFKEMKLPTAKGLLRNGRIKHAMPQPMRSRAMCCKSIPGGSMFNR